MSETFVDTSALYAFLVADDDNHGAARAEASSLRDLGIGLVTSSFVILETVSLLQARVGIAPVRAFYTDLLPLLRIVSIDEVLLKRAMQSLLAASRRRVSLTDWTSFAVMEDIRVFQAFAFDDDFVGQGFEVVPASSPD